MQQDIPEGFEQLPQGLGFTDILAPLYRREQDQRVALGMVVQEQHMNILRICHGGVLMTLADVAAASAVNFARGQLAGAPTISLGFDFISAAKLGEWLHAEADRVVPKRRFGFSSGTIFSGERLVCRFNGTFYFPDHDGFNGNLAGIAKLHGAE
jgi:uncharacterized protein (TIGR00369 family)